MCEFFAEGYQEANQEAEVKKQYMYVGRANGKKAMLELAKLRETLDSVVWYNGYWTIVKKWIEALEDPKSSYIHRPDEYRGDGGLEVLWMICVLLFGNYGTSPRSGWIEKTKECREFLIWLTKNTKEYEEGSYGCN